MRGVEKVKRVFILSRHTLFCDGIIALLSQESGFDVVGQDAQLSSAVDSIKSLRPDVVIINCDDPEPDLSQAVVSLLQNSLGVRIIGLSLEDNKISIYRGEDKQVKQVEDLLEAIVD